jgi:hypothetical protein
MVARTIVLVNLCFSMLGSQWTTRRLIFILLTVSSIELDGSLVKPDSRRWHHSMGNALWHTVSTEQNTLSGEYL